ncbi:MAG: efflux RND transporter permease subunit [Myxococcota bacterium]
MIWVVRRPVATWMLTIALLVFGLVSYQRLSLNLMPDLSYPTLTIRTEATGYAPEEVEMQVSQRIEESIATVQGISKLESRSRANGSDVILAFSWGSDMNQATQDVREKLQNVNLPEDVERPLILRYDPTLDPILRIALTYDSQKRQSQDTEGPKALAELRNTADLILKRNLESFDGVAAIRLRGGYEREVQVNLREDWLAARQLSIDQVIQTLQSENVNIPGGSIIEGEREFLVRTLNAFDGIQDLSEIRIRREDGIEVRLTEVAELDNAYQERSIYGRVNGQEAVELEIYKAADANIVQVANQLKEALGLSNAGHTEDDLTAKLPSHMQLVLLDDQAQFIESALSNLRSTAFLGAILAIVVLFLFLRNFRATLIIGTAIPLSIFVTFAPMYLADVSLNLMSLGGLALGIGMLVDNAVVVLENIQVQLDKGLGRKAAASEGTKQISVAVISSTLTTISVFLPITFVEGVAGQIFGDLSLSVVFSLLASLGVALYFVPMLAATELTLPSISEPPSIRNNFTSVSKFKDDWQILEGWRKWLFLPYGVLRGLVTFIYDFARMVIVIPTLFLMWIGWKILQKSLPIMSMTAMWVANRFQDLYAQVDNRYSTWIGPMLKRSGLVLGISLLMVVLSGALGTQLGQSLLPDVHQGRFSADISLPIGTPLGRTAERTRNLEAALARDPDISYVYSILGSDPEDIGRPGAGEHSIRLLIGLEPHARSAENEGTVMERVRRQILEQPNSEQFESQLRRPALFSFQTPIELQIYAPELDTLTQANQTALTTLQSLPSLSDVQSSLGSGYPELQIQYNRDRLHHFGLSTQAVAQQLRNKIQGSKATSISQGNRRIDLTVRLIEDDRFRIDRLRNININPLINPPIPLESVAVFKMAEGPSEIRRVDQQRAVVLTANTAGLDLSSAAAEIKAGLDLLSWDVDWEIAGQSEEMAKSLNSMQYALLLAVFLVYVIMASAFESFLHPFVILFSVPLAVVGVTFVLYALQIPLSVIVLIGVTVLAGVVVNNAIVLVDTINRLRQDGLKRYEAITQAASLRLRPILITTTTTALGLLPLAFGFGDGAEIQQPLAITIIAGLVSSTVLTLGIIPVVYMKITEWVEVRT